MENQTTVKDILIDVNKMLSEISIPVSMIENIGIPVARAISGIQLCIDAFEQQKKEQDDELKMEIVDVEPMQDEDKED